MFGMDPIMMMITLAGMGLSMLASFFVKSTFAKYAQVGASSGLTGAEAAAQMLASQGIRDVRIERIDGFLSDHYDPRTNTLRLSSAVYDSQSLSAIGVACHEAGHALQKATGYAPLGMRSALVPVTQFGSMLGVPLFAIGMIASMPALMKLGILLFAAAVLFAVVTLPVEWNASARAKRLMTTSGVVRPQEQVHAASVLNAAFLTYLAAAVTAVAQLLYLLYRAGLLGNRRD